MALNISTHTTQFMTDQLTGWFKMVIPRPLLLLCGLCHFEQYSSTVHRAKDAAGRKAMFNPNAVHVCLQS